MSEDRPKLIVAGTEPKEKPEEGKEFFSFRKVQLSKEIQPILKKYKEFLETRFAEALEQDKMAAFAAEMHKTVDKEDIDVILPFVEMCCAIHRFTKVREATDV